MTTIGGTIGAERPELGDGHGVVGEDLEQERLELVVGAVHLVDQQDRDRCGAAGGTSGDRRSSGPADEEPLGVELVLDLGRRSRLAAPRPPAGASSWRA